MALYSTMIGAMLGKRPKRPRAPGAAVAATEAPAAPAGPPKAQARVAGELASERRRRRPGSMSAMFSRFMGG